MATLTIGGVKFVCKKPKKTKPNEVVFTSNEGDSYMQCHKMNPELFPLPEDLPTKLEDNETTYS